MIEQTAEMLAGLLEDLSVYETDVDRYRADNVGRITMNLRHLFGGQVLAQALLAAAGTVEPPKVAHSLHAYFLRAGDARRPIEYAVERVRDGRRLSCRSVSAQQDGKTIATVVMSFADTAGGVEHQVPAPDGPPPEEVPTLHDAAQAWGGLGPSWVGFEAIEVRVDPHQVDPGTGADGVASDSSDHIWQRTAGSMPADPLLHQAVLVYMSDIMLLAAALVPHGVPLGKEDLAGQAWDGLSLDHAIWFHRPVRVDDWLLFAQTSPFASSGRSLNRAEVFDRDGRLLASTAQEGLIFDLDPA